MTIFNSDLIYILLSPLLKLLHMPEYICNKLDLCGMLFYFMEISGILRDKTINDKLIHINNEGKQNYNFNELKSLKYGNNK